VIVHVIHDGLHQLGNTGEAVATDAFVGEIAEPALHQIEPGTRCRGKMQMNTWMSRQPRLDARMLVRAVVVDDQVKLQSRGGVRR